MASLRRFLLRATLGSRRMSQGHTCVSKSDATQKIERWRVDGNEQRLHRSLGQLILAKPAQRQIHTRPSDSPEFLVRRGPARGEVVNSIPDLSEV